MLPDRRGSLAGRHPKFERRHYQEVALLLYSQRPLDGEQALWLSITNSFITMFRRDNPNFDRERFLMWCYQGNGLSSPKRRAHV